LDNGAFRDYKKDQPFNVGYWLQALGKALRVKELPYIAVVPDIVAGGQKSLTFSRNWLTTLSSLAPDFPWYLPVQDDMDLKRVHAYLRSASSWGNIAGAKGKIRGIFLGGTNEFKEAQGADYRTMARDLNLLFHYGRCGTLKKVDHALELEADSIDSAYPMWTEERWLTFQEYITGDKHHYLETPRDVNAK
jgi:hypothetical protein